MEWRCAREATCWRRSMPTSPSSGSQASWTAWWRATTRSVVRRIDPLLRIESLRPLAHDQPHGHTGELELLAEAVLEIAAVVAGARQRPVGEKHEGRRRGRDLGDIVELPGGAAGRRRRHLLHETLEEAIELAGAELQVVGGEGPVDRSPELFHPAARERRDVDSPRRGQQLVEPLEGELQLPPAFLVQQIPLVDGHYRGTPELPDGAGDRQVTAGHRLRGVDHQHRHLGPLDLPAG